MCNKTIFLIAALTLSICLQAFSQTGQFSMDSLLQARTRASAKIFEGTDVHAKEERFKAWIAKYPPENFTGLRIPYDYMRFAMGKAFAQAKQFDKALYYAHQLETPFWRAEGMAGIAYAMLKVGDTTRATQLIRQAIESASTFLHSEPGDNGAQFAAAGYPGYATTYAELMYKAGNYNESLIYMVEAEKYSKRKNALFYINYAKLYSALNKPEESRAKLETAVREGLANPAILNTLKTNYLQRNQSDLGYDQYLAVLKKQMIEKVEARIAKEVISEPAAPFVLKDLNGETVSLADYKGKVVVLDFWATWCMPCIQSFPAMEKVINRYKKDDQVNFLFIDTWEQSSDYETRVKSFLSKNKYDFCVLFDPKNKSTGKPKAALDYNVSSIPAKFIIDGSGKIRFKLTGFSGGEDLAVEELSAMIEFVKS